MVHAVNTAFVEALDYKTYLLRNCYHGHDGETPARTAKLTRRIKTFFKPYESEYFDLVTLLLFLGQLNESVPPMNYLRA